MFFLDKCQKECPIWMFLLVLSDRVKLSKQYAAGLLVSDKFVFLQHHILCNKTRNKAPNQST